MTTNLRPILAALLLASSAASALAERNRRTPVDFVPLTSLPWRAPELPLESVLETIF